MTMQRAVLGMLLSVCLASAQFGWFGNKRKIKKPPPPDGGIVGVVSKAGAGSFVMLADDTRVITFKTTDATTYFHGSRYVRPSTLRHGAFVSVHATADHDGNLTADEINFRDAPPVVKHRAQAIALLPDGVKDDPLVQKARDATSAFFHLLPNFICQQSTTRAYAGADHQWRTLDKITAEVVYDHGRESYRDVRLNGKPTGRSMMDLPGSRSTGEFGSTLRALFDKDTDALFKFHSDALLADYSTAIYDFAVSGDKSDWRITAGSQMIMAPYAGKIWIDKKSGNVVRMEMAAMDIPEQFPFRRVEAQVEYGPVILPSGRYFLPETAENVSCNDPKSCSRNVIEFRNYHKYVGESSISYKEPEPEPEPEPEVQP